MNRNKFIVCRIPFGKKLRVWAEYSIGFDLPEPSCRVSIGCRWILAGLSPGNKTVEVTPDGAPHFTAVQEENEKYEEECGGIFSVFIDGDRIDSDDREASSVPRAILKEIMVSEMPESVSFSIRENIQERTIFLDSIPVSLSRIDTLSERFGRK